MPDAIELLSTRSSFKAVALTAPGPTAAEIDKLLTIACRVPDHGKLTPWRFIVFEGEARLAAGTAIATAFGAKNPDAKPEHLEFERKRLAHAPLVIAVVTQSRMTRARALPAWLVPPGNVAGMAEGSEESGGTDVAHAPEQGAGHGGAMAVAAAQRHGGL